MQLNPPERQIEINPQQVECLAEAIYHEARGEPEEGQAAVAAVVLNRVRQSHWPDTVCDVVYEPGQFVWHNPKSKNHRHKSPDAWENSKNGAFAYMVMDNLGIDYVPEKVKNSTFFSSIGFKNPKLVLDDVIGNHKFYQLN